MNVAGLVATLPTGAIAGASLTAHAGPVVAAIGAAVGATALTAVEALARARQQPGEIPPLWARVVWSAALCAPLGWLLGVVGAGPILVGGLIGALAGALGPFTTWVIFDQTLEFSSGTRMDSAQQSIHMAQDFELPVGAYNLRIFCTFSSGDASEESTASSRARSCSAAYEKACASSRSFEAKW